MAENPALEAAMETYRNAAARLRGEAIALEVMNAPKGAKRKLYESKLVDHAADAELVDRRPLGLPSEVSE